MTIDDRMEILFLYEAKDCNPNGDPLDEDRPRQDPDTGEALVTDVRIKRTIRDYLFNVLDEEILVRDTFDDEGFLQDGKGRARDFFEDADIGDDDSIQQAKNKVQETILDQCIDARLFGATLPVAHDNNDTSVRVTGPVQFNGFSRSLHEVDPEFVQGTAAFASQEGTTQKSFREDFILPYACIGTYGIVNEVAAETSHLTKEDVDLLLEGVWNGTKNLISRSKMGHQPLFLMRLRHQDQRHIGDLASQVDLRSEEEDLEIRSVSDYELDVSTLVFSLERHQETLKDIEVFQDARLQFAANGERGAFQDVVGDAVEVSHLW
jgi:CRISPR-associated protein Csh2